MQNQQEQSNNRVWIYVLVVLILVILVVIFIQHKKKTSVVEDASQAFDLENRKHYESDSITEVTGDELLKSLEDRKTYQPETISSQESITRVQELTQ